MVNRLEAATHDEAEEIEGRTCDGADSVAKPARSLLTEPAVPRKRSATSSMK